MILEAEVFRQKMEGGRNKAALVSARAENGELVDCVIKMAAGLDSRGTAPVPYLFEWLAAAIAPLLGVFAARPYQVVITKEFAESITDPEFRHIAMGSLGITFGSGFQAGSFTPFVSELSHADQLEPATLLLAFDVFVHNYDRRQGNPNLLVSRDQLFAYDHGEAFSFVYALFGNHATDALLGVLEKHALCSKGWLRGRRCNFDGFRKRLAALTDEVFATIVQLTPSDWQDGPAEGKLAVIVDVLRQRRDAVDEWLPKVEAWLAQ